MGPEILIVGDRSQRGALIPRVQDLGYTVTPVRERELAGRVAASPAPAAVLICLGDADAAALVDAARRGRDDVPVVLFGNLGGALRDLADVLELGADHFLAAPVEDAELAHVLAELAGPGAPEEEAAAAWAGEGDEPVRRLTGGTADHDPVLGQLHRTLEILAARLKAHESTDSEPDALDLESLGLDAVPDVDRELGRPDPDALIDPESSDPAAPLRPEPTQRLALPRDRHRFEPDHFESDPFEPDPFEPDPFEPDHEDSRGAMQGEDTMRLREPVLEDRDDETVSEDRSRDGRTGSLRGERSAERAAQREASERRSRPGPADTTARVLAARPEPDARRSDATARVPPPRSEPREQPADAVAREAAETTARLASRPDLLNAPAQSWEPLARQASERAQRRSESASRRPDLASGAPCGPERARDEVGERGGSDATGQIAEPRADLGERGAAAEDEVGTRGPGSDGRVASNGARDGAAEGRNEAPTQRARGETTGAARRGERAPEPSRPLVRPSPRALDMTRAEPLAGVEVVARLWQLHAQQVQGRLTVGFAGGAVKQVWWRRGEPVYAASTAATDSLLARLQARGLLGRAQVAAAARVIDDELAASARRLVHAGLLKPREQQEAVRDAVRKICESLCCDAAERWQLDAEPAPAEVSLGAPMLALLASGVRLGVSRDRLREHLPESLGLRLDVEDPSALAGELGWPGAEDWLLLLDGTRSLGQLVAEDGVDERDLWAAGCVLTIAGLASAAEPDADAALVAIDRRRIDERLALARDSDYLTLLGVGRDASRAEVLRAHADLRGTFADDRLEPRTREELADALAELHAALDEAREVLLDEALRTAYLSQLAPSDPEPDPS